ncbi:MAG: acyl-CoA dehydrogenase [Acidobacteriota bacterium]
MEWFQWTGAVLALMGLILAVRPLRRHLLSRILMRAMAPLFPRMSETEREALEAGTVWWDGDLFTGHPNWNKLLEAEMPELSAREKAFLEGPVREVCRMASDWEITQQGDLPPDVWAYLKANRFFGLIIPRKYDGLEFSALAHSAIVTRCASHSVALAVTVMVPNSLGPAELLLHYGTKQQKRDYLPRLARGEEIPCFALTEPGAGSDAAGLQSTGIVCTGISQGREVLGIRLNWDKRYTTLSSVATVIGLAFRLFDPEHLLGGREDIGITCALVPANLPGVEIGARHDPLGVPFHNGPTRGRDVFIPVGFIIGGAARAGQGWRMLMQSLAAGRSISLPSLAAGGSQLAARAAGAYATVREQFGLPIGKFEGVQEPLARIGGTSYLINAARTVTAGAVDRGEKPSVLSAIVKSQATEALRRVMNDAMDILAGSGICRGPRNILANAYTSLPIGITVEGSNILTRTMIIFGQGVLRCHPHAQDEIRAVREGNLSRFDRAFFGHVRLVVLNMARSCVRGLTDGRMVRAPLGGWEKRTLQRLSRMSAAFAVAVEVSMATLGGKLKRREALSGRLADALAWLYLASATVKQFVHDGRPDSDRYAARWACEQALFRIQTALRGIIDNLPSRPAARLLNVLIFPLGARYRPPSDRLGSALAQGLLEGRDTWRSLTRHIDIPDHQEPGLGQLEASLEKVLAARPAARKLRQTLREGRLRPQPAAGLHQQAVADGILSPAEQSLLAEAEASRQEAVAVDAVEGRVLAGAPRAV